MEKSRQERLSLHQLAARLEDLGFVGVQQDLIHDWITDGPSDDIRTVSALLSAVTSAVWDDYDGEIPAEWEHDHPKPRDYDYKSYADYEKDLRDWKKAAEVEAKAPFFEAESEIIDTAAFLRRQRT